MPKNLLSDVSTLQVNPVGLESEFLKRMKGGALIPDAGAQRCDAGFRAYRICPAPLSVLGEVCIASNSVSHGETRDLLVLNSYKRISQHVLGYICYDLATQAHDKHCTDQGGGSAVTLLHPIRLLRFIVFAFACSLSSTHRMRIGKSLKEKLQKAERELRNGNYYFRLLDVVDGFRMYDGMRDIDSGYEHIIESAVDLLVNIASGKIEISPDARTSLMIVLLETRYMLGALYCAYLTLPKDGGVVAALKEISACDVELQRILRVVMRNIVCDVSEQQFNLRENLSSEMLCYPEVVEGAHMLISQINSQLQYLNNAFRAQMYFRPECVTGGPDICALQLALHNEGIVREIHEMVTRGATCSLDTLSRWSFGQSGGERLSPVKLPSPLTTGIMCSSAVAHNAKKFVLRLLNMQVERTPGTLENNNLAAISSLIEWLIGVDTYSIEDLVLCRTYGHRVVFRNLAANILVNVALGDLPRALGKDTSMNDINYRVLAQYINLFCNFPPNMMRALRVDLRALFEKHDTGLGKEIDDVLCMLTDLKSFAYRSSYTQSPLDYVNDTKNVCPCYYNDNKKVAIDVFRTLGTLLAHSSKKRAPLVTGDVWHCCCECDAVRWMDVLNVLLYECTTLLDLAVVLKARMDAKEGLLIDCSRKELHAYMWSIKLRKIIGSYATEDSCSNRTRFLKKIGKFIKKVDRLLEKCTEHGMLLNRTPVEHLGFVVQRFHDIVWDRKNKGLLGKEVDEQLIQSILLRSYISARYAFDIVYFRVQNLGCMPSLVNYILNEYFHCCRAPINRPTHTNVQQVQSVTTTYKLCSATRTVAGNVPPKYDAGVAKHSILRVHTELKAEQENTSMDIITSNTLSTKKGCVLHKPLLVDTTVTPESSGTSFQRVEKKKWTQKRPRVVSRVLVTTELKNSSQEKSTQCNKKKNGIEEGRKVCNEHDMQEVRRIEALSPCASSPTKKLSSTQLDGVVVSNASEAFVPPPLQHRTGQRFM